jgi:alcohol dehydrogenase
VFFSGMSVDSSDSTAVTIDSLSAGLGASSDVAHFADVPGGEVLFGVGALAEVGKKASALGASKVLLVTDPGLREAGHEERCIGYLKDAGLQTIVFDEVRENPTTRDVDRAVEMANGNNIDLIIGLGGGSSMDTAKGTNFILTNGGRMHDYWGVGKADKPMLPLIAIPTTSGTGSECQSFALIADRETHAKMACGDKKAAAAVAILDPELTVTQPSRVTAVTGIDAIAHAIETAVCNKSNATSLAYSKLAFAMLREGFPQVLCDSENLEARARMQLGAAYAGTAIENSMLGIAHSCANPLTAHYGTIHGQAVGVMLPAVIRFNANDDKVAAIYRELCGGDDLADWVIDQLALAGLATRLSDLGIKESMIDSMAAEAAEQWTAQFNPLSAGRGELVDLYRSAL